LPSGIPASKWSRETTTAPKSSPKPPLKPISSSVSHQPYPSTHSSSQTLHRTDSGNSDHEPSLCALIAGLLKRSPSSDPSFLIHLSGTGIVADWQDDTYLGEQNPKVWSDVADRDAIDALPDTALHRNTEKILQATAAAHGDRLKIAIVCPPDICGKGRGPGRTQSVLLPILKNEIVKRGAAFYTGSGANTRNWVHIADLMRVYSSLVEAASAGGGNAAWGKEVGIL
jgi:hypothetical protein